MSKATRNRWIMYSHQGYPGNDVCRLTCHESLDWAVWSFGKFAAQFGRGELASARLYPFTDDDWREARNFEDVGCPFDYPSKVIEFGPRGGLRITNA